MKFPTIYDYQHLPSTTATVRALLLLILYFLCIIFQSFLKAAPCVAVVEEEDELYYLFSFKIVLARNVPFHE